MACKRAARAEEEPVLAVTLCFKGLKSWKCVECRRYADTYYLTVRKFGRRDLDVVTEESMTKRELLSEESLEKRDEASDNVLKGFTGEDLDADIED
ncbi:hypothetical protein ACHAQH_005941 [Verticillium albo-atrum]